MNLTKLLPGAQSALLHRHSRQDEFIYILQGHPTLLTDQGAVQLAPGMCAGFAANGAAHHLVNNSQQDVLYLEIGDRTTGDEAFYPNDDLQAKQGADGKWHFTHKDGTNY